MQSMSEDFLLSTTKKCFRVAIVTNFPSYHNVDLFNSLALHPEINLNVFYLRAITRGRQWKKLRTIEHPHQYEKIWFSESGFYFNPSVIRSVLNWRPDILIVTQYAAFAQQSLMYLWTLLHKPWVFWSEAPGVKYHEIGLINNSRARKLLRNISVWPLRYYPKQLWAIGSRAQHLYQAQSQVECINVPYYFDQHAFRSIQLRKTQVTEPVKFLYVGKLVHRKGVDILLRAVAQLSLIHTGFELIVVGGVPDAQLMEELPQRAQHFVDFRGFKELAEIPSIYAECDVFVFPTRYDGWGMVVPEAMAAGMPVISSKNCGSALDLINAQNGFLYEVENVKELVGYMCFFIENRHALVQMGAKARQDVACQSAERGATHMAELVRHILAE